MTDNPRTKLVRIIITRYVKHFGLFWRIMFPVVLIAIPASLIMYAWFTRAHIHNTDKITEKRFDIQWTSRVNKHGASSTFLVPKTEVSVFDSGPWLPKIDSSEDASEKSQTDEWVSFNFPPGQRIWFLLPLPIVSLTDNEGITTWTWQLSFDRPSTSPRSPMTLLLLTLCPLSLCVAHILRSSDPSKPQQNQLKAREAWRQTGGKAFTLLGVSLTVVLTKLVIDVASDYIMEIPRYIPGISLKVWALSLAITPFYWFSTALRLFFFVAISLYNPCLILEDNRSIVGVLRRSWNLVRGAKWRFIRIYLLTGWIVAVIKSVLMGVTLLGFSLFIPDLAIVQDTLFSLKFLTFFIGADIQVLLPELLSPSVSTVIYGIHCLIIVLLLPIWAILTTYLYLERIDVQPEIGID